MTLLDTAGLCVLVFACLLYCFEKMIFEYDCYGIIDDTGGMLCSCNSSILPSSCRSYYNYRPRHRCWPRRSTRNYYPSSRHRPLDNSRNKSCIHNRRGQYRYFRNKYSSRTEAARARSNPGSSTEQPTSDPSSSPSLRSIFAKVLPQFLFPQVRCVKLIKLYYRVRSKYWSWKRRRCWQRHKCSSVLNDWNQVEDWTPTDIVNDITLPSHDEKL